MRSFRDIVTVGPMTAVVLAMLMISSDSPQDEHASPTPSQSSPPEPQVTQAAPWCDPAIDLLYDYLGVEEVCRQYSWREASKAASIQHYTLDCMIATVPDAEAAAGHLRDAVVEGIMRGFEVYGYRPNRIYTAPINPPSDSQKDASTTSEPSVVLLRSQTDSRSNINALRRHLTILFLVPESPIRGISRPILRAALSNYAEIISTRYVNGEPYEINNFHLRLLGPTFSGSALSLIDELNDWQEKHGHLIHVVTGTATSIPPAEFSRPNLKFVAMRVAQTELMRVLATHLRSCHITRPSVLLLTESSTGFGGFVERNLTNGTGNLTNRTDKQTNTLPGDIDLHVAAFPLFLGQVRPDLNQRETPSNAINPITSASDASAVELSLDNDRIPNDTLPLYSRLTKARIERGLASLLETVRRHYIQYVAISATDVRDVLLLAQFLQRHCPDVQLVLFNNEVLFTRPEEQRFLNGALTVSTYNPQYLSRQLGLPSESRQTLRAFSSDDEMGAFNACLVLLDKDSTSDPYGVSDLRRKRAWPVGYEFSWAGPCANRQLPHVWISSVGRRAIWPVARYTINRAALDTQPTNPSVSAREGADLATYWSPQKQDIKVAGRRKYFQRSLILTVILALAAWQLLTLKVSRDPVQQQIQKIRIAGTQMTIPPPHGRRFLRLRIWCLSSVFFASLLAMLQILVWPEHITVAEQLPWWPFLSVLELCIFLVPFLIWKASPLLHGEIEGRRLAIGVGFFGLLIGCCKCAVVYAEKPTFDWTILPQFAAEPIIAVMLVGMAGLLVQTGNAFWDERRAFKLVYSVPMALCAVLSLAAIVLAISGCLLQLAVLSGTFTWSDATLERVGELMSGVSPLTLLLLLIGAVNVGVGTALIVIDRWSSLRLTKACGSCLRSSPKIVTRFNRLHNTHFLGEWQWPENTEGRAVAIAAISLFVVGVLNLSRAAWPLEKFWLAVLIILAQVGALGIMFLQAFEFSQTAYRLRHALRALDQHPIVAAFQRLPKGLRVILASQLSSTGRRISSRFREQLQGLVAGLDQANLETLLLLSWESREREVLASATPPKANDPAAKKTCTGENSVVAYETLLAYDIADVIRDAFSRLGQRWRAFVAMSILFVASQNVYPVQPEYSVRIFNWLIVAAMMGLVLYWIARFNQDAFLSQLANTTPGQLTFGRDLLSSVTVNALLPLLALLAVQYPEFFGQWLQQAQPVIERLFK
ncbi:MAG: hypothetical protein K1X74_12410 [Pirellulales bacterium]|nr:hypothetical protein [Pirellulales bacterium]